MRALKFIIVIFLFSLKTFGQTNIQIIITNLGQHKIDNVNAFDISQKESYEYEYKETLNFQFDKQNIDCYNIQYHENDKMFRQQIWLDTGNIKILAHIDSTKLIIDTVYNSPMYYEAIDFGRKYTEIRQTHDTSLLNTFLLNKYNENIENPFSLFVGTNFLIVNQNSILNLIKLKALADNQGEKFSWFYLYPMVIERLNKILTVDKINLSAFSFLDTADKRLKLNLSGAEFYVLDFWFVGCAPCMLDHIKMNAKQKVLRQNRIKLISISIDENSKKWKAYLIKHKYSWQNYLQDTATNITKELAINSFPTYVIVNNKGDIIDTYNSFSDVLRRFKIEE